MALSYTNLLTGGGFTGISGSPGTITPTVGVNAGDVILIQFWVGGNVNITSINDGDTVNTAPYIQAGNFHDSTNNLQCAFWYKVVGQTQATASAITVTYTPTGGFINSWTQKITGFTGVPTLTSLNGTTFSQTVAGTGVVWSPLVTDRDNLAVSVMMAVNTGSASSGFGSFTNFSGPGFRQVVASGGTNIAVTAGVWSASVVWDAIVFSMYDRPATSSYAFVQQKGAVLTSAANTVSVTLDSNVVQGDALLVAVYKGSNKSVALSDGGVGNTFVFAGTAAGAVFVDFFYALNTKAGHTTITATETGASDLGAIYVAEYSGLATSSALLGSAFSSQTAPGSGTNAVTSGNTNITLTAPGAMLWGFTYDAPGTSNGANARGTGFTARTNSWGGAWVGGNGNVVAYPEDKRIFASGPNPATFSAVSANASDTFYTGAIVLTEPTGTLVGQTISTVVGSLGDQVGEGLTQQTVTGTVGTPTTAMALTLGATTATFIEGQLVNTLNLTGQTATFTEGVLTPALSGNVSVTLAAQSIGIVEGVLVDNVSYLLDQSTHVLVGQTATFSEGVVIQSPVYALTAQTVSTAEGTISAGTTPGLQLGAQTIVSAEGNITASSPTLVNATLSAQSITSSEGVVSATVGEAITAQTVTSAEGVITFSATGDFTVSIGSVSAVFAEGTIGVTGPPQGTGPPLFIPPQLGKPVTTRTFSWLEMASRAWGSEFRAPDHRIYQFSGGNYKDSTDLGQTGIYNPNLGTPDNP